MFEYNNLINWLLQGDPSISWQVHAHLLGVQMEDGGWNCRRPYGASHSSFHTTLIVLEAFHEYLQKSDEHKDEVLHARDRAVEFLLKHRLYKSHRTGRIVKSQMTQFCFPPRWKYDVMTVLDYLLYYPAMAFLTSSICRNIS